MSSPPNGGQRDPSGGALRPSWEPVQYRFVSLPPGVREVMIQGSEGRNSMKNAEPIREWARRAPGTAAITALIVGAAALIRPSMVTRAAQSPTYSVLYTFRCEPDGANPFAPLVRDSAGNLYGTTYYGGVKGVGSVFKVTPNGRETLLHSFSYYDGQNPGVGKPDPGREGQPLRSLAQRR